MPLGRSQVLCRGSGISAAVPSRSGLYSVCRAPLDTCSYPETVHWAPLGAVWSLLSVYRTVVELCCQTCSTWPVLYVLYGRYDQPPEFRGKNKYVSPIDYKHVCVSTCMWFLVCFLAPFSANHLRSWDPDRVSLFIHNQLNQQSSSWAMLLSVLQRKFMRAGDKNIFGQQPKRVWAQAWWFL